MPEPAARDNDPLRQEYETNMESTYFLSIVRTRPATVRSMARKNNATRTGCVSIMLSNACRVIFSKVHC